jgi:Pvc16 N-terminal domain
MSNGLAIAAVTSTVRFLLERALERTQPGPVGGAKVTTVRPERLHDPGVVDGSAVGINVYLYHATPNHALGQRDLPTRRADGSLMQRPCAALDLHYLLTFFGDDAGLDAQRLLGRAVTALAATPMLTGEVVRAAVDRYDEETDTAFLADADLADQLELVKLSPQPLSLEELSKLWSVFFQAPYLLSLSYLATVVVLEADVTPRATLPVRERRVEVATGAAPSLSTVEPDGPPGTPVTGDALLVLTGSRLLGPQTRVQIGPVRLEPEPGATPQRVTVALEDGVPSGLHPVQVLHLSPATAVPVRVVAASSAVPVPVRPQVTGLAVSATAVTLTVAPPVWSSQRVGVRLSRLAGGTETDPDVLDITFPPRDDAGPGADVVLPRADIPDGQWLVVVHVDGVESLPELAGDVYGAPSLTLPPP